MTSGEEPAAGQAEIVQVASAALSSQGPKRGLDVPHGQGKTILIIEDEPHISEAIRYILTRDGWRVELCADGLGALEAVNKARPDVVILDAMLPGRSGFEILGEIRADTATADLPVILLTANGASATRTLAEQTGASLFMAKPFANGELVAAVRDLAQE